MREKYLGVIPAFDEECLREVNRMPILYWSIKYAKESKRLSKFIVVTNNREVKRSADSYDSVVKEFPEESFLKDVFELYKARNIVLLNPSIPIRCNNVIDTCINVFEEEKAGSFTTGFVDKDKKYSEVGCIKIYSCEKIKNKKCKKKDIKYIVPEIYNLKCETELEIVSVSAVMKHLGISL